jgi:AhpC/TSA family
MRWLCGALLAATLCAVAHAEVVRPAPNFQIEGVAKGTSLRSYRGQTVVLLITRSARDKYFRTEVGRLGQIYGQFSAEKVLFVAAIKEGPQEVRSNIPFVIAANPEQVAADYGANGRFAIAVIGVDGNLDLITDRLIAAERVRDAAANNYESQAAERKPLGS